MAAPIAEYRCPFSRAMATSTPTITTDTDGDKMDVIKMDEIKMDADKTDTTPPPADAVMHDSTNKRLRSEEAASSVPAPEFSPQQLMEQFKQQTARMAEMMKQNDDLKAALVQKTAVPASEHEDVPPTIALPITPPTATADPGWMDQLKDIPNFEVGDCDPEFPLRLMTDQALRDQLVEAHGLGPAAKKAKFYDPISGKMKPASETINNKKNSLVSLAPHLIVGKQNHLMWAMADAMHYYSPTS